MAKKEKKLEAMMSKKKEKPKEIKKNGLQARILATACLH